MPKTSDYWALKNHALAAAAAQGFTVNDGESEHGDNGPGSRIYLSRPDAPRNQHGAPMVYAQLNRTRRKGWTITIFGED